MSGLLSVCYKRVLLRVVSIAGGLIDSSPVCVVMCARKMMAPINGWRRPLVCLYIVVCV